MDRDLRSGEASGVPVRVDAGTAGDRRSVEDDSPLATVPAPRPSYWPTVSPSRWRVHFTFSDPAFDLVPALKGAGFRVGTNLDDRTTAWVIVTAHRVLDAIRKATDLIENAAVLRTIVAVWVEEQ